MHNAPVDYQQLDYVTLKAKADALLSENGYFSLDQFPLPIEKIAQKLGYKVSCFIPKDKRMNEVSGVISRQEKGILLNSQDSYERQRFTLAHEIAHAVLHFNSQDPNAEFIDYRIPTNKNIKEAEADEFAACLLMPQAHFERAWKKSDGDFDYLSRKFYVSKAAVGVRAFNLGL